jgi:hypothetical protein
MIFCAGVARRKGCGHKGLTVKQRQQKNWTRDNVARGTSKGQMFGKTSRSTGKHYWNKDPKLKEATTSEEREHIRQNLRENNQAGDREANRQIFRHHAKN